jgi:pyruvate formate lyase activating enzyme
VLPEIIKINSFNASREPDIEKEELFGRMYSVENLVNEIKKDQIFYDESGGGVTFSGGEPLLQIKFLEMVLQSCKSSGINTAVDTSGYINQHAFTRIYDLTDLFLFDLKIIDDELHQKFTGVSNKTILDNLKILTDRGNKVIVRIPLIPGITDTAKNLSDIASFVMNLKNIRKIDLLPYNEIAEFKYKRFNLPSRLGSLKSQDEEKLNEIKTYFGDLNLEVSLRG